MEKVKSLKENKLIKTLTTEKGKYIVGTILLSGIGITLPRIFHILAGSTSGATFLPMHIAILIASLVFGIKSGITVAGSSIIFSYLLTGMPNLVRLPYMLIELLIYVILLGLFNKKYNSYISLIATMIIGRLLYAGVLFISGSLIGLQLYGISVIESANVGIPGIILQLICVPFIAYIIKKGLKQND